MLEAERDGYCKEILKTETDDTCRREREIWSPEMETEKLDPRG